MISTLVIRHWSIFSMFSALLDSYKYAVSTTRQIVPAPGQDVIENMLNSGDGVYMTAFVPHDEALAYFRSYNLDRYTGVVQGSDPTLLQKVSCTFRYFFFNAFINCAAIHSVGMIIYAIHHYLPRSRISCYYEQNVGV